MKSMQPSCGIRRSNQFSYHILKQTCLLSWEDWGGGGGVLTTPLIDIRTPMLWNSRDGVRGVYPRASKSLQYQILKLNAGINRDLGPQMEERMLASKFLVKCGVF